MPFRCTFPIAAIENSLRLHGPHMLIQPGRLAAELGSHTRSGSALIAFLSGRPRIPWFFTHWQDALIWFNLPKHFWICNYISLQTVQYLQSRKTGHSGRFLSKKHALMLHSHFTCRGWGHSSRLFAKLDTFDTWWFWKSPSLLCSFSSDIEPLQVNSCQLIWVKTVAH